MGVTRTITAMIMVTTTIMTTDAMLQTSTPASGQAAVLLMQWLSPAYPVGAFAYSHGLEGAVADGTIKNGSDLSLWLEDILSHGGARSDALLLAAAYHAKTSEHLEEVDRLARAFCPSAERLRETMLQGEAFCRTTAAIWQQDLPALTYPVALGHAARQHGLELALTQQMYLHAFLSNLVSAGQRLLALGQLEGQQRLSTLSAQMCATAEATCSGDLALLTGATFAADIASMRHETQYSRMFRS